MTDICLLASYQLTKPHFREKREEGESRMTLNENSLVISGIDVTDTGL